MTARVLWLGLGLLGMKGVALYNEVRSSTLTPATGGLIGSPLQLGRVRDEIPDQNRERRVMYLALLCSSLCGTNYGPCLVSSCLRADGVTLVSL